MNHREMECFLDMDGVGLDAAEAVILSVPFEGTVSFGTGTARGPAAALKAGPHLETFDEELQWEADGSLKLATLAPIEPASGETPEAFLQRVEAESRSLGLCPPFPLTFGGEHSISPAVLAGLRYDFADVTVVQIDAHADLRDEYNGSRQNHACAMARILDLGVKELLSIGIRSCTQDEFELARDDARITTWYAHELQAAATYEAMLARLRRLEGPVYLTIDIDGLDCTLCPATGTPQPGGLSWYQAVDVVRAVARESSCELFGADIVEVVPMEQSQVNEMVAAKLAMKILGHRFAPRRKD